MSYPIDLEKLAERLSRMHDAIDTKEDAFMAKELEESRKLGARDAYKKLSESRDRHRVYREAHAAVDEIARTVGLARTALRHIECVETGQPVEPENEWTVKD